MNDSRECQVPTPDRLIDAGPDGKPEPRWRTIVCFLLLLAAIQLVLGPKVQLSQWGVSAGVENLNPAPKPKGPSSRWGIPRSENAAVAEGMAWLKGQRYLDLPHADGPEPEKRLHDTAYFNGKVYNVFPPMMAFLTVLLSPLQDYWLEMPDGMWLQTTYVLLVFWPLPIVGFIVFRRQVRDSAWAALLTIAWMGGTAVLPNLEGARQGYLGQINHVVSQVGLLILAADLLGRQRIWPSLIGLAISAYTRQLTFLYGLPLLWIACRQSPRRAAWCLAGLAVVAAPHLTLNYLKFGNPLDFGYKYIYVGREADDYMGERCRQYGVFSPHFIRENFYHLNIAPPILDLDGLNVRIYERDQDGTSMWMTTPLAAFVFITAGWWWRDRCRRILMLGTLPVMLGLLCYHSPGFMQHGYSRFALDFLPIWLAVIAPQTRGGWRTWFALGCTAWSLLYFHAILPATS